MMQYRIQELTLKSTEAQSELQAERRRNVVLEKQLGKAKLDRVHPGIIENRLSSFLAFIYYLTFSPFLVHSFIHCRHLCSTSSSGATQKRSQPQHGRIMLF